MPPLLKVHKELGTHPGGVHLEMTGEAVTECLGGSVEEVRSPLGRDMRSCVTAVRLALLPQVTPERLKELYTTRCDPRLNAAQALEVAFTIAERFRSDAGLPALCVTNEDGECVAE